MAHRLQPPSGEPLDPREIVRRLGLEFPAFEADAEGGREQVRNMLVHLLKIREIGKLPVDQDLIDRLQEAETRSFLLAVADDPAATDARFECCAIPGEPLLVGYASPAHEAAAAPLLERCARALGYEVVLL